MVNGLTVAGLRAFSVNCFLGDVGICVTACLVWKHSVAIATWLETDCFKQAQLVQRALVHLKH